MPQILLKVVHKGLINNKPALVKIIASQQTCNVPVSEPKMA